MKQIILLAFIGLAIASSALHLSATQQSPPGWFIVFEEKGTAVSPVQFLKAQKEAVDLWKKQNPEVPVYAWQNNDNTLYRIIPILSFASIDTLYQKMEHVSEVKKAGSNSKEANSINLSTVSGTVMEWVPELSHHPEAEFSPWPDKPYTEWMFVYLLPDHEKEAEEALRKFRDYYIEKKLDYPWDTFRVLLGTNTPVMIGLFRAESQEVLQHKGNRIWKKHGGELGSLWDEVMRHTWKVENKTGWYNPSLSNIPITEPEEEITGGL